MVAEAVATPAVVDTQTPAAGATQAVDDIEAIIAEGVRGTDAPVEAQTTETPAEDDSDRIQREAREAERLQAIEEGKELGRREAVDASVSEITKQSIDEFKQHYPTTVREVRQILADAGGNDALVNAVIGVFDKYNLKAVTVGERLAHGPIEEATAALFPGEAQDAFRKDANGKTPLEYLQTVIEHGALKSKAVKSLTLEQAKGVSTKLNAEITKALADAEKAGRAKGRLDPPGDDTGSGSGTVAAKSTNYAQMQKQGAKGMSAEEVLKVLEDAAAGK